MITDQKHIITITSGVNAGIACTIGEHRIWCDVLHDRKVQGFSAVTPDLLDKILVNEAFRDPELMFFTHCHPDHYSRAQLEIARAMYPSGYAALPSEDECTQIFISGRELKIGLSDIAYTFRRLTHEGRQYKDVPHYGLLISCMDKNILIAGDCELCSDELREFVSGREIFAAVLPFPWITVPSARAFTVNVIRPEHLIINHLPLTEKDDIYGYRRAALKSAGALMDAASATMSKYTAADADISFWDKSAILKQAALKSEKSSPASSAGLAEVSGTASVTVRPAAAESTKAIKDVTVFTGLFDTVSF